MQHKYRLPSAIRSQTRIYTNAGNFVIIGGPTDCSDNAANCSVISTAGAAYTAHAEFRNAALYKLIVIRLLSIFDLRRSRNTAIELPVR